MSFPIQICKAITQSAPTCNCNSKWHKDNRFCCNYIQSDPPLNKRTHCSQSAASSVLQWWQIVERGVKDCVMRSELKTWRLIRLKITYMLLISCMHICFFFLCLSQMLSTCFYLIFSHIQKFFTNYTPVFAHYPLSTWLDSSIHFTLYQKSIEVW